MKYKIIYKENDENNSFGGFRLDGAILKSHLEGGISVSNYRARKIKKILEKRQGITDVHIVRCKSDGIKENKDCLFWLNYLNEELIS